MENVNEEKILNQKKEYEEKVIPDSLKRFPMLKEPPSKFYTPLDLKDFDFIEQVGFPGRYPFTSGAYAFNQAAATVRLAALRSNKQALVRSATYSGYGTPEDTRDYYQSLINIGSKGGPNLALDFPTQLGYDSDDPIVAGEVGKVGVSIDTLADLEIICEPFQGDLNLDKISTNFTVNACAIYLMAMYAALAEKRGISLDQLKGTPQNDPLKEYIGRQLYIFPPAHAMRLFRDIQVFMTKNMPGMNWTSIGGYHIRESGATRMQALAYAMALVIEYLQCGVDSGLDIDEFAGRLTLMGYAGSMEILHEIALHRASRRMYSKILKEKFGSKKPKNWTPRAPETVNMGAATSTKQRPLNNLTRAVIAGVASVLCGGQGGTLPPYDEPLGLGWSAEARQLATDAQRIIQCETDILKFEDPFAGSYLMESLTNEIEQAAWAEIKKIEEMGGMIVAIESGYIQKEIAKSSYEDYRKIQNMEKLVVGVNCYMDPNELEVTTNRVLGNPYDSVKRAAAEEKQKSNLRKVKESRDNAKVQALLQELEVKAKDENQNLFPHLMECAKEYVSLGEVMNVFRKVFGVFQAPTVL